MKKKTESFVERNHNLFVTQETHKKFVRNCGSSFCINVIEKSPDVWNYIRKISFDNSFSVCRKPKVVIDTSSKNNFHIVV